MKRRFKDLNLHRKSSTLGFVPILLRNFISSKLICGETLGKFICFLPYSVSSTYSVPRRINLVLMVAVARCWLFLDAVMCLKQERMEEQKGMGNLIIDFDERRVRRQ